jgi:hypothetical protein
MSESSNSKNRFVIIAVVIGFICYCSCLIISSISSGVFGYQSLSDNKKDDKKSNSLTKLLDSNPLSPKPMSLKGCQNNGAKLSCPSNMVIAGTPTSVKYGRWDGPSVCTFQNYPTTNKGEVLKPLPSKCIGQSSCEIVAENQPGNWDTLFSDPIPGTWKQWTINHTCEPKK